MQASATINAAGLQPDLYEASRFLGQASMGAGFSMIDSVAWTGIENWLDHQLNMPLQVSFEDTVWMIWDHFLPQ